MERLAWTLLIAYALRAAAIAWWGIPPEIFEGTPPPPAPVPEEVQ